MMKKVLAGALVAAATFSIAPGPAAHASGFGEVRGKVLDTVTGSDAERLYLRLGWQCCGEIPGYALWPQGGLCSTTVFYKSLADCLVTV